MNCIIIEDQAPAQRILKKYIFDYGQLNLRATFTNALQSIELLNQEKIDLIFLDIHLPKLSGVDFLKSIRNPPTVIFTTAFPDFALEGYNLNVADYLLKPFSFARFLQAMSKIPTLQLATTETTVEGPKQLFIKSGFEHIKVALNKITHIHSDKDYTEIHTDLARHLSHETLKHWENTLEPNEFIRVHKSYIVGGRHIKSFTSSEITLENETTIPIGRAYKDKLFDYIKQQRIG